MAQFKNKEEYEKWKEEKTKARQETIAVIEPPSNKIDKAAEGMDTVSYNCPSCNSENIQKASVVVSLGSKNMTNMTVGVGGGSSGINAGIGLSGGSIKSELAAKLSSPIKPPPANLIAKRKYLVMPSLLFMLSSLAFTNFLLDGTALGIFFIFLLIFSIYQGYFKWIPSKEQEQLRLEEEYARKIVQWEKTYHCLRCGTSFEISRE